MRVLLVGATGNVGLRLIPALLTHSHHIVAYIRSPSKLESLLPPSVYQQLTIIQGNATDSKAITSAILDNGCDAVINTAGLAAVAPWGKTDLPVIFKAVVDGVREAGAQRGRPLRAWFLGGQGVLNYPGTKTMLSNYMPIFLAHRENFALLESLPSNAVDWSILCPQSMTPESEDYSVPTKSSSSKLVASAGTPPLWKDSWLKFIPFLGRIIVIGMNASRYTTTLEQNAEFIASDLETFESRWSGMAVGVIGGQM